MRLETLILTNLLYDDDYLRKVIPFLKDDYFQEWAEKRIFTQIAHFVEEYNAPPSREALAIAIEKDRKVTEDEFIQIGQVLDQLERVETNKKWLIDETEKFCKDKAVLNAIMKSIQIIDGRDKNHTPDALPSILQDALAVSFDSSVGHDYIENAGERFEFYQRVEERIPFDLDMFNKITKGGLPRKTLNVCLAGTGVGKSLFMCHMAAAAKSTGKNVLYITMEMAEERIAERIDANLMNTNLDDLIALPKQMFDDRIARIKKKSDGRLIIKEYPTSSAHAGHFRGLLNELQLKKKFVPDIIFIDYLNICASSRYKMSNTINSYTYIKGIAEELRGLAVEFDVPIVTATQTTRSGYANSDVDLTDTSESFGLPATADFMFALISTEDLEKLGQLLVKQLKNRYASPDFNRRFVIGVDRPKMKLYDVSQNAQKNIFIDDEKPAFAGKPTAFTSEKYARKNFDGIKV